MEQSLAIAAFSTLGHPGRLAVFRLLMRFAPQAVRPTEIAQALNLKPNTLSHHLGDLAAVGLIRAERQGRSLLYSVDLAAAEGLVGYLVMDCLRARPDILPLTGSDMERAMPHPPCNVLFLCSGNSARSIFAEAILRQADPVHFTAYSAGTAPGAAVNPFALDLLARNGLSTEGLRSKSQSEFQGDAAPKMDFVFTVCDTAAAEDCAPWVGQPMTAHWGVADPVKAGGSDAEKALAFAEAFAQLYRRILAFAALPLADLTKISLQHRLDSIGRGDLEKDI